MLGNNKEKVAVNFLVDFLVSLVLHIIGILVRNTIDDDLLGELYGKSVLIDSDLLDVVAASNLDTSFSHQMLDDNIGHELSVSVTVLVESVNSEKLNVMRGDCAIIGPCKDLLAHWVHASGPDPLLHLGDGAKKNTIFVPQCELFIASSNRHVLTCRVE